MIVEQQPCKVPDDPILNFIDFMGRYTILLNGTVLQKEATKGELQDLADEHKKEVIDKFKRLWESRPIANNGVSCEDILELMLVDDLKESGHAACSATYKRTYFNWCRPMVEKVLAKLPTTAINNGVSFDSIVDKLTHLNGDHLMGLELNDIHIIANFITRLPTTAPRGGNMIDVVKKAVESGAVVIKPCTANCLNGIITDHEGAEVRDIVCPTCSGREYVITEGEVSGG